MLKIFLAHIFPRRFGEWGGQDQIYQTPKTVQARGQKSRPRAMDPTQRKLEKLALLRLYICKPVNLKSAVVK